jgi:hypothetical protein
MRTTVFALILWTIPSLVRAQDTRPVPYPVFTTPQFDRAVEAGTRTLTGEPGPNYWTNTATYDIDAVLSPETRRLSGSVTIEYLNNSPDTLDRLVLNLYQNLHAEGNARNRPVEVTGGVHISCAEVNDVPLVEHAMGFSRRGAVSPDAPGYTISGTQMSIRLPDPVPPAGKADLHLCWNFVVPEVGQAPRMGTDNEVFYLGYWYPQFAVYDDVTGSGPGHGAWDADNYLGSGEFYMGYADYNVRITVPEGWLVAATGALQNPEEILSDQTLQRLAEAASQDSVVHVVTVADRDSSRALRSQPTGTATWHFTASNVRDVAFGTSNLYLWDATRANVGDRDADGTDDYAMIHAFYRPDATVWPLSAEFSRFSIEHLSKNILPYPWPHMTAVEGIIGGGMEYPMITLIGGRRGGGRSLFGVTYHEIAHMWFPMIVGSDEKELTWMDEGLTTFNTGEGSTAYWNDSLAWHPTRQPYYYIAGSGLEVASMRHGDNYPPNTPAHGLASYSKPSVMLNALRGILGNDLFYKAYREYARRWAYKHPTHVDFFNTFEDVVGNDLDWFWRVAFYETWRLDQAIENVAQVEMGVTVTVSDQGLSTMPAPVRVTYADGHVEDQKVGVNLWLAGARKTNLTFPPGDVVRVEIDPEMYLPDVDRENNVWEKESSLPE